jgi:hypothetical protein
MCILLDHSMPLPESVDGAEKRKRSCTVVTPLRWMESLIERLTRWLQGLAAEMHALATSAAHRQSRWLMLTAPNQIHTWETYTKADRYPDLFRLCVNHFGRIAPARILSFGCSTGEEALTLRKYFPQATIIGTDANGACLAEARTKTSDTRIRFIAPAQLHQEAAFDAVFCLAVLRNPRSREPGRANIASLYPIERFDAKIEELATLLVKNGILVLHNCDYRLEDSPLFALFRISPQEPQGIIEDRIVFDRAGNPLPRPLQTMRIFIKQ